MLCCSNFVGLFIFRLNSLFLLPCWASKFTQSMFALLSLPYCKGQADNMVEVSCFLSLMIAVGL